MPAVALTIAGSDPSGGAGIQAALKTFPQFGVYGEADIPLLTVQNTLRVSRVEVLSPDLVLQQIEAVVTDIAPLAAKTGALGSVDIIEAVADRARAFIFPLVVDPVMISKHGARLLSTEGERALIDKLLPRTILITPNIPEAEALTGMQVRTEEDMAEAGQRLCELGCQAALIKGGHSTAAPVDILATQRTIERFPGIRINSNNTHGTGCTLSAAITACLALGHALPQAVRIAKNYIQQAIETAPGLGSGHGPVNHFASPNLVDQEH